MQNLIIGCILLLSASNLYANHVGIFVRLKGDVSLLSNPSKKSKIPKPIVLYNKMYYTSTIAKKRQAVYNGNLVRTGPDSKARIIFKNGDTISVAPNTFYKISWNKKSAPIIELLGGALRAIISKTGDRKGLKVKTKAIALGVRGTDFYVKGSYNTEISVLRGEVAFKERKRKGLKATAKEQRIQSGYSASIKPSKNKKQKSSVIIAKSNRRQLQKIVLQTTLAKVDYNLNKKSDKELYELEKKSANIILLDIKDEDPTLYQNIIKGKEKLWDPDHINEQSMKKLKKTAQKTKSKKTSKEDLEKQKNNPYDRFLDPKK